MSTRDVSKPPRAVGNLLMTVMFASLALVYLMASDFLGGGIWLGMAAALAVMGPESTPWRDIALWRRVVGAMLLGVSLILMGCQIFRDFSV